MKILSWPRAAPEPPPGVEVTDINGFMVSLGRGDRPFVMMSSSCDNPDCPCTEIHLGFIEVTPEGPEHGLRFAFDLDTNTWQEPTPPSREGEVAELVGEFIREAPPALKEALLELRRLDREAGRRMRDYRFTPDELDGQDLVPYMHICAPHGSLTRGGGAYSYELVDGDRVFAVDDLYCAAPGCRCKEALLLFFERSERDGDPHFGEPFAARVPFGGGRAHFEGPRKTPPGEARRLLDALRERNPGLMSELRDRYREIKERAARQLDGGDSARVPQQKADPQVGRNSPCPCGSGKKYKRCCGR